jgi:dipeptidyl aminopeptidase/acylaminoacyl peptidase
MTNDRRLNTGKVFTISVAVVAVVLAGSLSMSRSCETAAEAANAIEGAETASPAVARRGRLFSRGFLYKNDRLTGMAIVVIDPDTGAWKRLVETQSGFAVSPDGQTITFEKDDALWNSDAETNANPGKIFGETGRAVFAPDSRSMFVTTWRGNPEKPAEMKTTVWTMDVGGLFPSPAAELDGCDVRDWSADGRWLLVERPDKGWTIHIVRRDGRNLRQLVKAGGSHPRFSTDGRRVLYVRQWKGMIRLIDSDGANDSLFFQAPNLVHVLLARWSPDGRHIAVHYSDMMPGEDGEPSLSADPKVSHPRIVIFDATTKEQRILQLPTQDGWDFYPSGDLEWR